MYVANLTVYYQEHNAIIYYIHRHIGFVLLSLVKFTFKYNCNCNDVRMGIHKDIVASMQVCMLIKCSSVLHAHNLL